MSDKSKSDITKPLTWLAVLHVLGVIGLRFHETQEIFTRLIPVYFLVTLAVLLYYQKHWNIRIIGFLFFVFTAALAIQALGLHSGTVFGLFRYGKVMGPKVFDTPIAIGVMWLVIIYCAGLLVKNLKYNSFINAGLAAAMLVMLNVLIEPVAMKLGMWGWEDRRVPAQNYAAWFVVSYLFVLLMLNLKAKLRNDLAPYVFVVIAGFFLAVNLF